VQLALSPFDCEETVSHERRERLLLAHATGADAEMALAGLMFEPSVNACLPPVLTISRGSPVAVSSKRPLGKSEMRLAN
jgi:hypothetical protein